jgi:hypothetical protein
MMPLARQAWWSAVKSCTFAAMIGAAACGGSESSQPRTEAPPQSPREAAATATAAVTEKPFVSDGKIDMQLEAGNYTVRPGDGTAIRVTLGGNVGAAKVDVTTRDTQANVSVKETPNNNFQATIDVPRHANLVTRLTAGELKVEAITGNKDIESYAGNVNIVTGDATDYASVDASVRAGDINAGPFGESQSGLFRNLTWSGKGKYTLRAKLTAGNLTLRDK